MFIVLPTTADSYRHALDLILQYMTEYHVTYEEDKVWPTIKVTARKDYEDDLHLCEMAFQMNFSQVGSGCCPVCTKDGDTFCGHLTFAQWNN